MAQAIPCLEKNEYNEEKVTNAINNYNLARIVAEEEVKTAEGLTKAIIERTIQDCKAWIVVIGKFKESKCERNEELNDEKID